MGGFNLPMKRPGAFLAAECYSILPVLMMGIKAVRVMLGSG